MIINSRFHDFYDHAMSLGEYDPADVRYVRETQELDDTAYRKIWPELVNVPQMAIRADARLVPFTILFCGKIERGARVCEWVYDKTTSCGNFVNTFFYDYDGLVDYLTVDRAKLKLYDKDKFEDRSWWSRRITWLDFLSDSPVDCRSKARDHGGVVISFELLGDNSYQWLAEPKLSSFEFYRVMPPFQAYQELSMWIGGVLPRPDKPMVTVSDAVKIHKRGFDKWSFRKMPSEK